SAKPDPALDKLFQARPFAFARLYRDYGQDKRAQATNLVRLALAYWDGGVAQASPQVARDLIKQARALNESPTLEAAAALVGLPYNKRSLTGLGNAGSGKPVSPDEALVLARFFNEQGQPKAAESYLKAALKENPHSGDCLGALANLELRLKGEQ